MRAYGPAFLHLYGVDEDVVLTTWTLDRFERYRDAADQFLSQMRR